MFQVQQLDCVTEQSQICKVRVQSDFYQEQQLDCLTEKSELSNVRIHSEFVSSTAALLRDDSKSAMIEAVQSQKSKVRADRVFIKPNSFIARQNKVSLAN